MPHRAGWWLASPENEFFRTMEGAVKTVWDQQPLRIREGGVSSSRRGNVPFADIWPIVHPVNTVPGEVVWGAVCAFTSWTSELRRTAHMMSIISDITPSIALLRRASKERKVETAQSEVSLRGRGDLL